MLYRKHPWLILDGLDLLPEVEGEANLKDNLIWLLRVLVDIKSVSGYEEC